MKQFPPGTRMLLAFLDGGEMLAEVIEQNRSCLITDLGTFYSDSACDTWRVDTRDTFFIDATAILLEIQTPIMLPAASEAA